MTAENGSQFYSLSERRAQAEENRLKKEEAKRQAEQERAEQRARNEMELRQKVDRASSLRPFLSEKMANDPQLNEFHQELLSIFDVPGSVQNAFHELFNQWHLNTLSWEHKDAVSPKDFAFLYSTDQILSLFDSEGNITEEGYVTAQNDYVAFLSGNRAEARNQVPSNETYSELFLGTGVGHSISLSASFTREYQVTYTLLVVYQAEKVHEVKHNSLDDVCQALLRLADNNWSRFRRG